MWTNVRYAYNEFGKETCILAEKGTFQYCIPMDETMPEYREIMALIAAGKLTIASADEPKANTG